MGNISNNFYGTHVDLYFNDMDTQNSKKKKLSSSDQYDQGLQFYLSAITPLKRLESILTK